MKITSIILIALIVMLAWQVVATFSGIKHCSQFISGQSAQRAFLANPIKYAWADRDHDGLACEHLPKFKKLVK